MTRRLLIVLVLLVPTVASAAGSTPRVVAKIKVGSAPCAGVAGFGAFWQTSYGTATLSRINPKTNKVTKRVCSAFSLRHRRRRRKQLDRRLRDHQGRAGESAHAQGRQADRLGAAVWDVAYAFGSVWATNNLDGSISRIDPATNRIVKTIATGGHPTNLGAGADTIWVGNNGPDDRSVYRIDPETNTSTAVVMGRKRPSGIVVTATAVWVANGDNTVTRLDRPRTRPSPRSRRANSRSREPKLPTNDLDPEPDREHDLRDRPRNEPRPPLREDRLRPVRRARRLRRHVGGQLPGRRPLAHPAMRVGRKRSRTTRGGPLVVRERCGPPYGRMRQRSPPWKLPTHMSPKPARTTNGP